MNTVMKLRCEQLMTHFSALCGVDCYLLDEEDCRLIPCGRNFCESCGYADADKLSTHLYGLREARRWGGKYIYYCPIGLMFVAAAIESPGNGAIIAGPMLIGDAPDSISALPAATLSRIHVMPGRNPQDVNHMCEVLAAAVSWITHPLKDLPQGVKALESGVDLQKMRHYDSIYKAIEYIKIHYKEKMSLDDIASHVGLSRTYLSSVFREEVGVSLFAYINHFRIEVSKLLLLDTSLGIIDIAGESGFVDQSYFTRVFRKFVGTSPNKFRSYRGNV